MMSNREIHLSVSYMCKKMMCSKSGYYLYVHRLKHPTIQEMNDEEDYKLIKLAYDYKNRNKGAKQIKMVLLNDYGVLMNLKKIKRLMK
ncbi:IS3 family transposase, partial [Algoriella sp.]|uniref:IS3 family transposase n=1 Tax=Algoriella sp. TaxID=1872434 RepID=UPI002FCACEC6